MSVAMGQREADGRRHLEVLIALKKSYVRRLPADGSVESALIPLENAMFMAQHDATMVLKKDGPLSGPLDDRLEDRSSS